MVLEVCNCNGKGKPHVCGNVLFLPAGHYIIDWSKIASVEAGEVVPFDMSDGELRGTNPKGIIIDDPLAQVPIR